MESRKLTDGGNQAAVDRLLRESPILTSMLNHLSDVIFYKDAKCRYVLVNRAFADLVAREINDIPGGDDFDFFDKSVASAFRKEDLQVLESGQPLFIDSPAYAPGGLRRIFETVKLPFKDADGTIQGVIGVARDITARKAYQAEVEDHAREMGCLVSLLQYFATFDVGLSSMMKHAVQVIPTAWAVPDDIKVRIMLDGAVEETPGTLEDMQELTADIQFDRHYYGYVSLGYYGLDRATHKDFRVGRGPRLLDVLANQLAQVAYRVGVHRALIESEYRHRILTEHSPVGLLRTDDQGQIIDCNQAAATIFETTADRLRGLNCFDDVTESGLKQVIPIALAGNRAEFEGPFRSAYGHTRYLRIVSMPLKSPSGSPETISTLEDVSERKRNEEALAASQASLAEAQRIAHVGSWEIDFTTGRLRASAECKRIFQVDQSVGEVESHQFLKFFKGDFRDQIEARLKRAANPDTETRLYSHVALELPDGSEKWVNIHSEVEKDSLGIPKRIFGIVHDVTQAHRTEAELRDARDQAEAASRAKSAFMANVSHEIRTPMNAIIGMTSLVLDSRLSDRQRDYLNKINGASRALLGIIDDILDFSRIEADRMVLQNVDFSVENVLTEVIDINEQRIEKKGIELHTDFDCDIPQLVRGDPLRLHQVLNNLVGNAAKFTMHGDIIVKVSQQARSTDNGTDGRIFLQFDIIDTGIGMTREQIADLFMPFSQLDGSTTREFGGTGLGLALCRKLVALMKGTISVESEPGEGSTFSVRIPFDQASSGIQEGSGPAPSPALAGRRALIIDDNPTFRKIITRRLEHCSMATATAVSGEDAIETVKKASAEGKPFDIILVDLEMPGIDGIATARELMIRTGTRTPMVLMTTAYMFNDQIQAQAARVFDSVLFKPLLPTSLGAALGKVLLKSASEIEPDRKRSYNFEGRHILLVEDNRINQQVALELIRKTGARVSLAENGREALAMAGREQFDLILMDIQMPEMDGLDATMQIRRLNRDWIAQVPIIAMTAHGMSQHVENSIRAGMNAHLTKPVHPDQLFETLARWLKGASSVVTTAAPRQSSIDLQPPRFQHDIDVPGLNVGTGLSYVGGNINLYRKLLRKFVEEYHGRDACLEPAALNNNPEESFRFVHSVKGLAGTLGATGLQDKAAVLEKALHDRDYFQSGLIEEFRSMFTQLLSDIRTRTGLFDPVEPAAQATAAPVRKSSEDPARVFASLSESLELLQPRQSARYIATLMTMEWPSDVGLQLGRVQDEIRNYRLTAALAMLKALEPKLATQQGTSAATGENAR
ncbi:MAG TPA: response regulator [Myxococcota bacterium]|nr:response regulator [Myxococcota bacterium]